MSGRTELGLLHMCSCCGLLSGGRGEATDPAEKGQKCRKWGGKFSGSMSCALQGGLEQKCFLCPISSVHTLSGEEESRVLGLCIHTFFPTHVLPCAIPSSAGCPNQTASWLKPSFKMHHYLPPFLLEKLPSPQVLWGPDITAALMRGFMCVIHRQSETYLLDPGLDCH